MSYTDFSRARTYSGNRSYNWRGVRPSFEIEWVVWFTSEDRRWGTVENQVTQLYTLEEAVNHIAKLSKNVWEIWDALIVNINTQEFIPPEALGLG